MKKLIFLILVLTSLQIFGLHSLFGKSERKRELREVKCPKHPSLRHDPNKSH